MALQEAVTTPEGGFLELLFMFHDYKVMCSQSAHKEYKTNTTSEVVSLEKPSRSTSQEEVRQSKKMTHKPPYGEATPRNGARGRRERQDYLAPTSTSATTPVPRWSKWEAKM